MRGAAEEIYLSLRSRSGEDVPVLVSALRRERDGAFVSDCALLPMRRRSRYEDELLQAKKSVQEAAARQQTFMRDVLLSVTDGVLRLCEKAADLPDPLPLVADPIPLITNAGIPALRRLAIATATAAGMDQARQDGLATAVGEAAMNALRHARGGVGQVGVDDEGTVQVRITDRGTGISLEDLPHATLRKGFTTAGTLGHGMKMVLQTVDRVYLLTGTDGTTIVMEQDRAPQSSR